MFASKLVILASMYKKKYLLQVNRNSKYIVFCIVNAILFFSTNSFSSVVQQKQLEQLWQNENEKTEARMEALQKLIENYYIQQNQDSAKKYSKELLDIAKSSNNKLQESIANNLLGIIALNQNSYKESEDFFKESLKINEELKDNYRICDSYIKLGNLKFKQGNSRQALRNYDKAIKEGEDINNSFLLASTYNSIGDVYYYHFSSFRKSLKNYIRALEILKSSKNVDEHCLFLSTII